ncbi:hypothetical protein V8C43DRAFT_289325 [Trichoderma afarasin]
MVLPCKGARSRRASFIIAVLVLGIAGMAMYEYSTILMMLAQPSSVLGSFGPSDGGAEHDLSPLLSSERGHFQVELRVHTRPRESLIVCWCLFRAFSFWPTAVSYYPRVHVFANCATE